MKLDWLLGRPLPTSEDSRERLGISSGIATFGLDALSSAAYGPEAALTLLLPLGAAGVAYILPISVIILALLTIVTISYQQTILAYPDGGGSYVVASENLGPRVGLAAAAALIVDYLLDVAVGISAGVGALVSAVPALQPHTVALCLGILLLLTVVNLRGVREAGTAFVAPTYLFVGCLLVVIVVGLARSLAHGGHPQAVVPPPHPAAVAGAIGAAGAWLLIRAFAGGCTALTGIEAVSNGVPAFREPAQRSARRTLGIIAGLLAALLAGIAYLVKAYGIVATPPGAAGYRSVLSMLTAAVVGTGWFYYLTIASILLILALSANTAFAGFPRLCRLVAERGYLPNFFAVRGRRLVYSTGILVLAVLAGVLLFAFGGITDRLIPLFAIGAFLAFTLSQAGMVVHWLRKRGAHWRRNFAINGIGALATGITVCVVLVAKFTAGAWITVILIPGLIWFMLRVRLQYLKIRRQVSGGEFSLTGLEPPVAVVPIAYWNRASQKAVRFACTLASEVHVLHVHSADDGSPDADVWQARLDAAASAAGVPAPKLKVIESPYRFVVQPIVDFILREESEHPGRQVAVVVPEVAAQSWQYFLLHNFYATALKAKLLLQGDQRTVVIDVPWYIHE